MDKPKKSAKKIISIIVFIVGLIALAVGAVFFVLDLTKKASVEDADYLVSMKRWTEKDNESVIWEFTEIGKGTLTTNSHTDDYDFIWAIEDGTLKIETAWLYDLNDEFSYVLDQENMTLTLTKDGTSVVFVPLVAFSDEE